MNNEVAISLPFSIDPYGNITNTSDQAKIWSDRVKSVIGTALRERVMRPSLGTDIPASVYDSQDNATNTIQNEVHKAFALQLGLLKLTGVNVNANNITGTIEVAITYDLPNLQSANVNIGLANVRGTTPLIQEQL